MVQTGWEFTDDPKGFLEVAGEFLASDPLQFTVLATVASRAAAEQDQPAALAHPHPFWFAVWRDAEGVVASATMRTANFAPHPLWLLPMPPEAARDLARCLLERSEARPGEVFGVNGALPAARICADELASHLEASVRVTMHSRLFRCDTVIPPARPRGDLRRAVAADEGLVVEWFTAFHAEADAQAGRVSPPGTAAQITPEDAVVRVAEGRMWLWEVDGEVVHMTGVQPPSFGTVRVGPVFTPAEHRGHGYAAWVVALVTTMIQTDGHLACLFTDQANPVSNGVYQRIGYTPVVDTAGLLVG